MTDKQTKEFLPFSGKVLETKEIDRNGVPIGIVAGYIATWDVDRTDDQFIRGCFAKSIADLQQRQRQARFKAYHNDVIGGFPAETLREDEKGLYGIGEINLEVEDGKEVYMLAKQGVLTDFSIGFSSVLSAMENGIRKIKEAIIWEGSIVDEPMNPFANVTEVKGLSEKFTLDDVTQWTIRDLEKNLKLIMSGRAAAYACSLLKKNVDDQQPDYEKILKIVNSARNIV